MGTVSSIDHALPFQCTTPVTVVAQTSFAALPQMSVIDEATPLVDRDQVEPSQWRMVPFAPPAHASPASRAHTAWSVSAMPLATIDQTLPSQWRIAPFSPTAHTSAAPVPEIAISGFAIESATIDQDAPFQWRIIPRVREQELPPHVASALAPTAQTSLASLPQMPERSPVVPLETANQDTPSQRRIVPPWPTAHMSLAEAAHSAVSVLP
jgi:hypothetical protein